nr:hypothetical protein [uncultured Dongia sp.]
MTKQRLEEQKATERRHVLETAKRLGRSWEILEEGESPDFIIRDGAHRFGLEVTEMFSGAIGRNGSILQREVSNVQRRIDDAQAEFELQEASKLTVKFVGDVSKAGLKLAVAELLQIGFAGKAEGHLEELRIEVPDLNGGLLKVSARKAKPAHWFDVASRIGWVNRTPARRLRATVVAKAKKFTRYQQRAGQDIRLLIVADQFQSSGKFQYENAQFLRTKPFTYVYWLSIPEVLMVFDCSSRRRKYLWPNGRKYWQRPSKA